MTKLQNTKKHKKMQCTSKRLTSLPKSNKKTELNEKKFQANANLNKKEEKKENQNHFRFHCYQKQSIALYS